MIAQAEKWANSSAEVEERVDPDLIGGFVLRLDDRQIDASILTQINELKSSFDKNLYIPNFKAGKMADIKPAEVSAILRQLHPVQH